MRTVSLIFHFYFLIPPSFLPLVPICHLFPIASPHNRQLLPPLVPLCHLLLLRHSFSTPTPSPLTPGCCSVTFRLCSWFQIFLHSSKLCFFAVMQALLLSTLFRASALQAWWLLICGVKTVLIHGRICSTHLATFNRQTKLPISLLNTCYMGFFKDLWFNCSWVVFHGRKIGVVLIKRPSHAKLHVLA